MPRRDPSFLDLDTNWKWVVSFMPRPLYPRGKSLRYSLDTRLDVHQSWSGWCGEEKILDPSRTQTPTPWSSSPQSVTIPIALSRVLHNTNLKQIIFWYIEWYRAYVYRAAWLVISCCSKIIRGVFKKYQTFGRQKYIYWFGGTKP
jgi:hypothetical protein